MTNLTLVFGILFIILGLVSYFGTGMQSITALIPAFFGLILSVLGYISRKESARKTAIHIAMGVGLLGLIGSFSGLIKIFALLGGAEVTRPYAVIAQAVMAIICLIYLILGIKTFVAARKINT